MKKVFKMTDLDCAACAAKMERAIGKIDGVHSVNINFMSEKLTLDADSSRYESILNEAVKACKKIEPDSGIDIRSGR